MKKQPPQHKPMTVDGYAKISKIPKFVFRFLCRKGYMNFIIQEDDYPFIKVLEAFWDERAFFIGAMSRCYSIQRRWEMVQTADYHEGWKKFVLKRYIKHYHSFRNTPKDIRQKLQISQVITEVEFYYKKKLTRAEKADIKGIRTAATMRVKRHEDTLNV